MKKVVIIGATSAMAAAVAKIYADQNSRLFLVGRNTEKLTSLANDLQVRGADKVGIFELDINEISQHKSMLVEAEQCLEGIDIVLIAHGTLPDQKLCEQTTSIALSEFNTNATNTIALLTEIANSLEQKKSGVIAVITSVAGDRGRPSNYLYGSAKAAVSTFLEGLRVRMFKVGVHVLDIRPGFVATPMTQHLDLPKLLIVEPEIVANSIVQAIDNNKDIIYTPFFWKYIILMIKLLPNKIFKRLSI
ncbi:TPA: SDR family oxidoreductase [Vibrio cholerae]|nr:putative reductase [Vibrio cholerae]GIA08857.1 oxidoreductase [Vibrio cholerae]